MESPAGFDWETRGAVRERPVAVSLVVYLLGPTMF